MSKKSKLEKICDLIDEKIMLNEIIKHNLIKMNYISTENMLPDKNGIIPSKSIPSIGKGGKYKRNDTLLSNIRPYFKKIWLAKDEGACSNDVLIFRAKENYHHDFLYYNLANDAFFAYAMKTSKGTKMPRGDKTAIKKYDIYDFDYRTQQKLTKTLRLLDDEIELKRQINTNLERQAQAIFKEMFIDNDCNQHGDNYSTFQELISFTSNGYWGQNQPNEKDSIKVVCIRGTDIPNIKLGAKGKIPLRYISYHNYVAKQLKEGDIVIEISGGSPTQSTGRCIVITETLLNRYEAAMICTNFCKLLRPKKKYSMFIYYYLQYFYQNGTFFSYENGTTGIKNLDIMSFLETELIKIPSDNEITIFNQHCNIIFNQIFANGTQIDCLSALRDTLLPKLMSGEIDVSKIELD